MPLPTILQRLVCAKMLFRAGVDILEKGAPFASGRAVLSFQDSAELALRTVAEDLGARLPDKSTFEQIIDGIDKLGRGNVSHRLQLFQLNRVRVSFKHAGIEPTLEDAQKSRNDLESFLPNLMEAFLGVDFSKLSLASLVSNKRVSNWLVKAEASLEVGDFEESIEASAGAFELFMHSHRCGYEKKFRFEDELDTGYRNARNAPPINEGIFNFARKVEKDFNRLASEVFILKSGIDSHDYQRFKDLTPDMAITGDNTVRIVRQAHEDSNSYVDALFCVNFVTSNALKLQGDYRPDQFRQIPLTRRFRVLVDTPIVASPKGDPAEEIRLAKKDEEIIGHYPNRDREGYFAILQDGDSAFIAADAVEVVRT